MKRFKILFGQRRFQVLATMAVVLLAVSVVIASGANFTATSANPGNVFTAGTLTATSTGATMSVTGLKPDDAWVSAGSITVTNTGNLTGAFSMVAAVTGNTPGTGHTAHLSDALNIKIHDHAAAAGTDVYSGAVKSLPASFTLGNWTGGASHQYDISVQFPNGGTPGGADLGDNMYQGGSMTMSFTWNAASL